MTLNLKNFFNYVEYKSTQEKWVVTWLYLCKSTKRGKKQYFQGQAIFTPLKGGDSKPSIFYLAIYQLSEKLNFIQFCPAKVPNWKIYKKFCRWPWPWTMTLIQKQRPIPPTRLNNKLFGAHRDIIFHTLKFEIFDLIWPWN